MELLIETIRDTGKNEFYFNLQEWMNHNKTYFLKSNIPDKIIKDVKFGKNILLTLIKEMESFKIIVSTNFGENLITFIGCQGYVKTTTHALSNSFIMKQLNSIYEEYNQD